MTQQSFAEVAETHSAVVYFAGDRAFKLKKPVKLGFLDFSTRHARAAACARKSELNRRFAPEVYLGIAEVHAPDGQICDQLVVMPGCRPAGGYPPLSRPTRRPGPQCARSPGCWQPSMLPRTASSLAASRYSMRGSSPGTSWTVTATC